MYFVRKRLSLHSNKNTFEMVWKKIKDKDVTEVERFNVAKPARISQDLFEFEKCRWRMGVLPARLLMMVSQQVSKEPAEQDDLFPLEFSLDTVFKYLGLTDDNARYAKLASACDEFLKNGLSVKTTTKRGATRWVGITFINKYEFSTDYPALRLKVNPDARQFLCNLHQYALLQPKHYLKLSTEYQNWFYPYLKMRHLLGSWEVLIEDLLFMLYLEKSPAYTTDKNANRNFFERVLGITKPKDWKYNAPKEVKVKKERKADKDKKEEETLVVQQPNKPWEYARNDRGEFIGTLYTISKETDINVTAFPIKKKGKYVAIHFEVGLKPTKLTKMEEEQQHKKATANDIQDMGKPERKGRSKAKQPQTMDAVMKDLFNSTPLLKPSPNPMAITPDIPVANNEIPAETVREVATARGMAPEQLAKQMGYVKLDNGNYKKQQ